MTNSITACEPLPFSLAHSTEPTPRLLKNSKEADWKREVGYVDPDPATMGTTPRSLSDTTTYSGTPKNGDDTSSDVYD
jgi:hypothetical protein